VPVLGRYGNEEVRYAICSVIMQRVVGMTQVSREDQQHAHAYAVERRQQAKGTNH